MNTKIQAQNLGEKVLWGCVVVRYPTKQQIEKVLKRLRAQPIIDLTEDTSAKK